MMRMKMTMLIIEQITTKQQQVNILNKRQK